MPRKAPPKSLKRIARAKPLEAYIPKQSILATSAVSAPAEPQRSSKPTTKDTDKKSFSEKIYEKFQNAIAQNKPHFPVGGREVYFPHAKIVLLRPSAKHTPYQAKFAVPRYFNKLDLRDYLYHVYGLRALSVTTQLLWSRWTRDNIMKPRYRTTQTKKMTVEMEDPFLWPEPVTSAQRDEKFNLSLERELRKYGEDAFRVGSDALKPPRAFGGIVGPYVPPASPYLPKKITRQMLNKKAAAETHVERQRDVDLVKQHLGFK